MCLIRIHSRPRKEMFAPDRCDDPPPIPLKHLDVTRITKTSLDTADEMEIEDIWDGSDNDCRELSEFWTGEAVFYKFYKDTPTHQVVMGRMTRIQKTKRPPTIWPERWEAMTKKQRRGEADVWEKMLGVGVQVLSKSWYHLRNKHIHTYTKIASTGSVLLLT